MTTLATLKVETRDTRGKGAAGRLRRAGSIPGSLYGREIEPISVQADIREFTALVSAISVENTIVELSLDGDAPRRVLIREIQRHPVRPDFLHVDFYEIRAGEKLKVNVPLHLIGIPIGVRNGGTLQQVRHELEVECLPSEIPPSFEIDISGLEIGDSFHISDVDSGALEILEDGGRTICAVAAPRVVEEPVDEEDLEGEFGEEDAEPEVITARGDDDSDEGSEGIGLESTKAIGGRINHGQEGQEEGQAVQQGLPKGNRATPGRTGEASALGQAHRGAGHRCL